MRLAVPLVLALTAAGLARAQSAPPKLAFPLACTIGKTCEVQHYVDRDPGPGAKDYRCSHRTYDKHDGIDIRLLDMKAQQRGVDVLAAAAGRVVAIRDGVPEGTFKASGRGAVAGVECGNRVAIAVADGWITDYCHMARGSIRVKTGDMVAAGQPIGKVGLSGMTEFPHLHISVRHNNVVVDPFAPQSAEGCSPQAPLWTPQAARAMAYKTGAILNAGLAGGPLSMDAVEAGDVPAVSPSAPAIVAYFRAIEVDKGDVLEATLNGPGGGLLATGKSPPLDRDKAQYFYMAGRKRPPAGWSKGTYTGELKVWRGGKVVMSRQVTARL
jgi:hypothetical protein